MMAEASEAVESDLPTVIVPVIATLPLAVENKVSFTVTGPASKVALTVLPPRNCTVTRSPLAASIVATPSGREAVAERPTPRFAEIVTRRNAVIAEFATNVPLFWNEVAMLFWY